MKSKALLMDLIKTFPGLLSDADLLIDSDPVGERLILWLHQELTENKELRKELEL